MAEVFFNGPAGRLEGRYHKSEHKNAPVALVLHPHPVYGGTMNNKVVYNIYRTLVDCGFSVLRINFRGVGKSQGAFDNGIGELADAAAAMDWLQAHNQTAQSFWISGFSFGAYIGMQLMMRRPEISRFLAISPPVGKYDFSFLSPCPIPGFIIQGDLDSIVNENSVSELALRLSKKKNNFVEYSVVAGGDHFFRDKLDELRDELLSYIKSNINSKIEHVDFFDEDEDLDEETEEGVLEVQNSKKLITDFL
jgi:alpha/beta superfamily hydrolase